MGSQPHGLGQEAELTRQANANDLKRAIPDWARYDNGVLMKDVELTYEPKSIGHGLGRLPRGWLVVSSYSARLPLEHARDVNQLVLSLNPETVFWPYAWVSNDADLAIYETPVFQAHEPCELLKAQWTSASAMASDGTDYRTFYVSKRAATDYTTAVVLAEKSTATEAVTAFTPWDIALTGTAAQLLLARGDVLTFKSDTGGAGKALDESSLELTIDAVGPRKVDLWVY